MHVPIYTHISDLHMQSVILICSFKAIIKILSVHATVPASSKGQSSLRLYWSVAQYVTKARLILTIKHITARAVEYGLLLYTNKRILYTVSLHFRGASAVTA